MGRLSPRRWQHAALGKHFFVALVLYSALQANGATATPALAQSARQQIGVTLIYDGRYQRLDYPNGDVPAERGVCTDVVIRAFRELGIDLQQRIHEDMQQAWQSYPKLWGLTRPDRNIDHRRVPNMAHYFQRQGWKLTTNADYLPGDLVTWMLPGNLPHIGIVSEKKIGNRPLIIHNIGAGVVEEDMLTRFPVTGHFRPVVEVTPSAD
ncbi:MAG: DUF1287 domain-containing protein [Pseudomonadota bacterium]